MVYLLVNYILISLVAHRNCSYSRSYEALNYYVKKSLRQLEKSHSCICLFCARLHNAVYSDVIASDFKGPHNMSYA